MSAMAQNENNVVALQDRIVPVTNSREMEFIALSKLTIDHGYQRELDEAWVRKLVARFDAALIGEIEVNIRPDSRIVIIDGQHRYEALKRLVPNPSMYNVRCIVNRVASITEEVNLYLARNAYIKQATRNSTFEARLIIGDAHAIRTRDVIERYGYTPFTSHVTTQVPAGMLNAGACEQVLKQHTEDVLDITVRVLRVSYQNDHTFQSKFITGLAMFIGRFRNDPAFDESKLIKMLAANPPDILIRKGANTRTLLNVSSATGVAMAIHWAYNHGKANRLASFSS